MMYRPDWSKALLSVCLSSALLVVVLIAFEFFIGWRVLTGIIAVAIFLFWVLSVSISLGHLSSSVEISDGKVIHLSFGRIRATYPISELLEIIEERHFFPGILRFKGGREIRVSGIALGKDNGLIEVLRGKKPDVKYTEFDSAV